MFPSENTLVKIIIKQLKLRSLCHHWSSVFIARISVLLIAPYSFEPRISGHCECMLHTCLTGRKREVMATSVVRHFLILQYMGFIILVQAW